MKAATEAAQTRGDMTHRFTPEQVADLEAGIEEMQRQIAGLQEENAALLARVTCCCGEDVERHGMWDGHTPVSQYDHSLLKLDEECRALRAENERLRAEMERLKSMTAMTMGVGSGDGNLFVHGDYESIKAAQAIVLERNALRAENERLRIVMDAMQGANDALLAAGEDHDDFEAMVARIILDRDALRQRVASAEATLNDLIRDAHERVYDWQSSGVDDEAELWRRTELAYRQALALLSGAAPK